MNRAGTPTDSRVAQVTKRLADEGFQVKVEIEEMLRDTGRYAVYAIRPGYRNDPRKVVAAAGTARAISTRRFADAAGYWVTGASAASPRHART